VWPAHGRVLQRPSRVEFATLTDVSQAGYDAWVVSQFDNHKAAVALHFMPPQLCPDSQDVALRLFMETEIADHVCSLAELARLRGPGRSSSRGGRAGKRTGFPEDNAAALQSS
jgi:hypothetical protein